MPGILKMYFAKDIAGRQGMRTKGGREGVIFARGERGGGWWTREGVKVEIQGR